MTFKEIRAAANVSPSILEWEPVALTAIISDFCDLYGSYLLEIDEDDDKVQDDLSAKRHRTKLF